MTADLHPSIADVVIPKAMTVLPLNAAGYPVPWFVAWIDGVPDFRVMDEAKLVRAVRERRCWVRGSKLKGPTAAFVIGPMCAINRTSAEPPSHRECAVYAAKACPFLVNPSKRRREGNKPPGTIDPAGVMIARNPGVALVWVSARWTVFDDGRGGALFNIGRPVRALWFAEGRPATRDEVLGSIESGLPLLAASAGEEGDEALAELERRRLVALDFLPDPTAAAQ